MSMDKREAVKSVYPSPNWARKVNNMSESQVVAVFMRLQRDGKI